MNLITYMVSLRVQKKESSTLVKSNEIKLKNLNENKNVYP